MAEVKKTKLEHKEIINTDGTMFVVPTVLILSVETTQETFQERVENFLNKSQKSC